MRFAVRYLHVVAAALAAVLLQAATTAAANSPFENIKTKPVAAQWQYSRDGGKTFSADPIPGAPPSKDFPCVIRGTFEVPDPASIAGLWIAITDSSETCNASICIGDLVAASGGYWKDLGFCPTLLNTRVLVNGREWPGPHGSALYFWMPVEAALQKGRNTIDLRGDCYSFWQSGAAAAISARMIAAEPQPAAIYNGPILGDVGEGYFTLACRTQMPAELTVTATPTEPAGKPVTVLSDRKIWHRVKIEVPQGTRAVTYTLTAKVGTHQSQRGPFTMTFPGQPLRFAAFGNTTAHPTCADRWAQWSTTALNLKPAFILNTGNPNEHSTWEFDWDRRYCLPAEKLLSSVPTFFTPCGRDFAANVNELHYTPAPDTYGHSWTKVFGSVRIIGLDGNQRWTAGNGNSKWLEETLRDAKEKFVLVLQSYV